MVAASPTLQGHINELPDDIARKAADHMRFSTGYGRDGGAIKFEALFHTWWRGLSRGDQDAIFGTVSQR
jgi:hypothetical protein